MMLRLGVAVLIVLVLVVILDIWIIGGMEK